MSSVEDQVRAATRAQADTMREVPPLRLTPGRETAPWRGSGARLRRARRWKAWVAPVTAAAAVAAIGIALVIVRDIPNGRVVPPLAAVTHSSVPPYYVALATASGWYAYAPLSGKSFPPPGNVVVGETLTGKRLATIAPPNGSEFVGVTGAADDRTFVVSTIRIAGNGTPSHPVTWYLLRIEPGSTPHYRLTRLAIPDMRSWAVQAIALSGSGREIAMTLFPAKHEAGTPYWELRIYSVATGKLLGSWSANDPTRFSLAVTVPGLQDQPLSWSNGDRVVNFPTFEPGNPTRESERMLFVIEKDGNLLADSVVLWPMPPSLGANAPGCLPLSPLMTAGGRTVVCATISVSSGNKDTRRVTFAWLAYDITRPTVPHVRYKVTVDAPSSYATLSRVLWSDPSGSTLIVEWAAARSLTASTGHYGVVSHGTLRPLPAVPGYRSGWTAVAW
jgi:hypothetical protein